MVNPVLCIVDFKAKTIRRYEGRQRTHKVVVDPDQEIYASDIETVRTIPHRIPDKPPDEYA